MKTISANLKTEVQSGAPVVATCWLLERTDGTILGFTDWPENFDYGGRTYSSAGGYQRTAIDQREGISVDNMDVVGLIDSAFITEEDLLSGFYRGAKVWIFFLSPPNLSWGEVKLDYGVIGEVHVGEIHFVAEFRSLMTKLSQDFGDKYSRYCRHKLGESSILNGVEMKCGIILKPDDWVASTAYALGDAVMPTTDNDRRFICTTAGTSGATEPTWNTTIAGTTSDGTAVWTAYDSYTKTGSVTSVTNDQKFADSTLPGAVGSYQYGVLTWTSGNNIGRSHDVKKFEASGVITVRQQAARTVQVGDDFEIHYGCNHILKMPGDTLGSAYTGDCRARFSPETGGNAKNYGGEPELPNIDRIASPAGNAL